jgi:hypothetical protein
VTSARIPKKALVFSPEESGRFHLRVFRGEMDAIDPVALCDELRNQRVDVAIVRLPAHALASIGTLDQAELRIVVADTLVHYSGDLRADALPKPSHHSLRLCSVGAAESAQLGDVVRAIFSDYTSHYNANKLFAPSAVVEGYAEWAVRHAQPNEERRQAWLIEWDGKTVGFSCVQSSDDGSEVRGTLNGILPAARGYGVYGAMFRSTLACVAASGARRFTIATQVHNLAVQRVWSKEGFVIDKAENTIHINALFGADSGES